MRSGSSLRTQSRIAVDAVTGSSPRIRPTAGITAAIGSAEKRMMTKPITALQKPATIQGSVTANRTSATISMKPKPPGATVPARQAKEIPPWSTINRTANSRPPGEQDLSGGVSLRSFLRQVLLAGQVTASHSTSDWCRLTDITRQAIGNSSPRLKKMAASATADTALALWYCGPGKAEIRAEILTPPEGAEVRVRALYSAISRGTESLVFAGRVPESEFERMRAPFMAGDFPFPVKYGYAAVGRVEDGRRPCAARTVFALHPHQNGVQHSRGAGGRAAGQRAAASRRAGRQYGDRAQRACGMRRQARPTALPSSAPASSVHCVAYLCGRIPGAEVTLVDINPARAELAAALGVGFR